jgi:uncharacterized protein YbbC (DUF1343 family)
MVNFSYFFSFLLLLSCNLSQNTKDKTVTYAVKDSIPSVSTVVGADRLTTYVPLLKNKKVALVVNHTSVIGSTHLVDSLIELGVEIEKIFAPEHGFRGDADAGELLSNSRDGKTGLPILSLYGKNKKPTPDDLQNIDVILFDIQDVGVRFYTYLSTLHYVMEACAEQGKDLIVLDRPNPNGHYVDGFVLEPAFKSFVGLHPVPVVYGMTIGEYATMINGEKWLANGLKCKLNVVTCKNYTHEHYYELPIPPSPNLPNMRSVYSYPWMCFFEGTNLSLGRGTDKQFQVIGHPALKGDFSFTPMPNKGSKEPPLKGMLCHGIDLSGDPIGKFRDLKSVDLSFLVSFYREFQTADKAYFLDNNFIDKLAGTDRLRKMIIAGKSALEIKESWKKEVEQFKLIRSKYLLYP